MLNMTNDLIAKLLNAQSAEEAAALVKAAGEEITAEEAEKLWEEIAGKRREADGKELSLDELESISGGADRNWVTDGCAGTVEYGSWCTSNDRCYYWDVTYDFKPTSMICPDCGKNMYFQDRVHRVGIEYEDQYRCKFCGRIVTNIFVDISISWQ